MKSLCAVLFSLMATAATAADVAERIRAVVPAAITLHSLEEGETEVTITGLAPRNDLISELMRAIDQAALGTPELESIRRENDVSRFSVKIRLGK